MNRCLFSVGLLAVGLFLCGVHYELEVPIFKNSLAFFALQSFKIEGCIYFFTFVNVRQRMLEADFTI